MMACWPSVRRMAPALSCAFFRTSGWRHFFLHSCGHVYRLPVVRLAVIRGMSMKESQLEVINIQDRDDFDKTVLNAQKPVVVDFHASWCGPCKLLGPRLENIVAEQLGSIIMVKVDIDEHTDLALEYGVKSVPMVMSVKRGKIMDSFIGMQDEDKVRRFVKALL